MWELDLKVRVYVCVHAREFKKIRWLKTDDSGLVTN